MALVKCNNCNQMISDKAEICPNCGTTQTKINTKSLSEKQTSKNSSKKGIVLPIITLIAGLLIGYFVGISVQDSDEGNGTNQEIVSSEVAVENTDTQTESENVDEEASNLNGTINVIVDSVTEVDWDDNVDAGMKVVSVNLSVENIDYKYDEYWDDDTNPYLLDAAGIIRVTDMDGYTLEFYDISGPDNGEYQLSSNIAMGSKARVGAPYKVKEDCTSVLVSINGGEAVEYKID